MPSVVFKYNIIILKFALKKIIVLLDHFIIKENGWGDEKFTFCVNELLKVYNSNNNIVNTTKEFTIFTLITRFFG